jgi:DMSO/TMAO reductase YedYZ molybdopterin-dependent catalytic subunit
MINRRRLEITGKIDKPMKLLLNNIKKMPAVELVAVNESSGNSRGFFEPRVALNCSNNRPGRIRKQ